MNSVMDDNKLLTLANGERIRLQPYARLLFEVSACFALRWKQEKCLDLLAPLWSLPSRLYIACPDQSMVRLSLCSPLPVCRPAMPIIDLRGLFRTHSTLHRATLFEQV